jgi:hypothetical protein
MKDTSAQFIQDKSCLELCSSVTILARLDFPSEGMGGVPLRRKE